MKQKNNRWLLPILIGGMTLFIWVQSLLPGQVSAQESGFVTRLLAGLFGLTEIPRWMHVWVRKAAHFTEFGALGALWSGYGRLRPLRCSWLYGLAVAAADECLQFIRPDRGPAVTDVLIDYAGYLCGWMLVWLVTARVKKKEI